ncbi:ion transport domain-containing protein [Artemisia annua]|uniref:Ion transport domain-containing protein n=1 Tax=Artemisia annua TaxID=35608 RepID=A0A2U1LSK8_ARTAN|nr:ion transport domain-containing protein [Artemisia annua]
MGKSLFFFFILFMITSVSAYTDYGSNFILGEDNLGHWRNGILSASAMSQAPGPANDPTWTLVLAGSRTNRPDILDHFKRYHGGWDITNKHYWASVGFTGAAAFILAILWFVCFGLAMIIHHCCGLKIDIKGKESRGSQTICLVLLLVFTCASAVGCILLSVGQGQFHGEAVDTLNYVVNQSDYTVQTLLNVTGYLSLAKTVNVAQFFLPSDVKDDIDRLNIDLNNAANTLSLKTRQNSHKIRTVFDTVRSSMIAVAIVMLLVSLLGLFWLVLNGFHYIFSGFIAVLSILGHKNTIYIFIISGWLLVAVTFILCGVFVIINNAISDTCMAMGQWVDNPHAETALSNILPCVDQATTNATLYKSKLVVNDIANIMNGFIGTYANANAPQGGNSNYYNQSGPLLPYLCYPYDSQLRELQCPPQLVSIANASESVGFTGAAAFILAILWFVCFGLAMIIHHCCGLKIDIKGKESRGSQTICLVLLLVFTCASAVGCILLSVGQGQFHGEAVDTLNYVVNQSDYTVQTLLNVTGYLSLAKTVNVAQFFLPSDVKDDIDRLNIDLNNAANTLSLKTRQNSHKIRTVFDTV